MAQRESMSGADAAWLHMDRPNNLMVVETLVHFATTPDWDAVEAAFTSRVVRRFPRFRQRTVDPFLTLGAEHPAQEVPRRLTAASGHRGSSAGSGQAAGRSWPAVRPAPRCAHGPVQALPRLPDREHPPAVPGEGDR